MLGERGWGWQKCEQSCLLQTKVVHYCLWEFLGAKSGGKTEEKGWQSLQERLEGDGVSEGSWVHMETGGIREGRLVPGGQLYLFIYFFLVDSFKQYFFFFHDFGEIILKWTWDLGT